jgi:predicted metal-dependent hydrolase
MQLSLAFELEPERRIPNPEPRTPNFGPRSPNFEPRSPNVVFTRHPRARRYVLRVGDDGTVHVTVPRWGSKRGALEFAASERPWVEKQLRRLEIDRERRGGVGSNVDGPERDAYESIQRERARRELPARLLALAAAHGLTVARISIRNQRWRWGSCNRAGHICLNWRLVTMPEWVRDYVLIHELMHLKRMDHSSKFWQLVAAACPRYEEARRWLRRVEN